MSADTNTSPVPENTPGIEEEQRLRQMRDRQLGNLFEQAPVAMAILRGPQHRIEIANQHILDIWGRTAGEVLGKPMMEALPEVNGQGFDQLLDQVYATGARFVSEETQVRLLREGTLQDFYVKFIFEAIREEDDSISGIMQVAQEITEQVLARQLAERQSELLREDREVLHSFIRQSPANLALVRGSEHIYEVANEAYLQAVGKQNLIGKTIREVFPELTGQGYFEMLDQVYRTGNIIIEKEARILLERNGKVEEVYFDFSQQPLLNEEGKTEGILMFNYEVTETVKARRLLAETNAVKQGLYMNAPAYIHILKGPDHVFEFVNAYFNRMFPGRELLGKPVIEALQEIVGQGVLELLDSVYQNGETVIVKEVPILLAKGIDREPEQTYFDLTYLPIRGEDGTVSGIQGFGYEITDLVLARQAKEESEQTVKSILDSLPTLAYMADPDGYVTFFNQAFYDFTGLSFEEASGSGWVTVVHPDWAEAVKEAWQESIQTGADYDFSFPARRASDQTYRWQLSRASAIRDEMGRISFWAGTVTDIHEQKAAEEALEVKVMVKTAELRQTNETLLRSNHALEQFAYIASHDLQEPLRKIQTFADLLGKNLNDTPTAGKYVEKIISSSQRMSELIRAVLNYSRLSETSELFALVELDAVLKNVETDFEILIAEKKARIRAEPLPVIEAVPLQMSQLFSNLLSNALKFSQQEPLIDISCRQVKGREAVYTANLSASGAYYEIIFKDNGIGFEQQYGEKVFGIFQRLHDRKAYAGTGIGLALCRRIVETHHGSITARSKPGVGTSFYIYLPVYEL
jgi:PAS domain S-box-containing protein